MPKQKTKKGVRKRFRLTKSGRLKMAKASRRHILTKKSRKRKRGLSRSVLVSSAFEKKIKKLLPYG